MSPWRRAADLAMGAGRPERAWDAVAEGWRHGSHRVRWDARAVLEALAPGLPLAAWTEDRLQTRTKIGLPPPDDRDVVGQMAFPAVGGGEGRFVTVTVRLAAEDAWPDLDAPTGEAVRRALEATRGLLRSEQGFNVQFDNLGAWSGASCGLAVACAAVSVARGKPLSGLPSATGALAASGGVHVVGGITAKRRLRREARPRGRMLIPVGDEAGDPWIVPVATLQDALDALELPAGIDPAVVVREVRAALGDGRWLAAARGALGAVDDPELADDERLLLLTALLAAANHAADLDGQDCWSGRLRAHLAEGSADEGWARALGSLAVARLDQDDLDGARALLALEDAVKLQGAARLHVDGPAALLAIREGALARALELRRANLDVAPASERPRCQGDLADVLLRMGELHPALGEVDAAIGQVEVLRSRKAYLHATLPYLRLHRGRILLALGRAEEGLFELDQVARSPSLDPSLRARLDRAAYRQDIDNIAQIEADLGELAKRPILAALVRRARRQIAEGGGLGTLPY